MKPVVLLLLCLGACSRALSPAETAFVASVHGATIATAPVRLHDGALIGNITRHRPPRPWKACRERIFPPEDQPEIETSTFGFVLGNRMFIAQRYFSEDYLHGYPKVLPLTRAMLIAHEMTHVWQWQNRALTGYAPWKAAREHAVYSDPYLFELSDRPFLDYPYEQQAALVEEFVCCRALDPGGARTERLHALLSTAFPDLPRQSRAPQVALPWDGVETRGICG
ncbi:MAG: hypothetical protein ACK5IB_14080 [Qingshengfaniella sp.]